MVLRFGLWISHHFPLLVVVSRVSPASLLAGADSRIRARSDPIVNLAVFALLYPLFQLTSTVSIPQPLDPSLPSTSSTAAAFLSSTSAATPAAGASFSIAAAEGGSEDRGRRGSPLVPERVRVLVLADLGFKSLKAAFGGGGGGGIGGPGSRKKDAAGYGHGGGVRSANAYSSGGAGGGGAYSAAGGLDPYAAPGAASSAYGSAYASNSAPSIDPYAASSTPYAGHVPQATPPRRGHAMNDSADVSSSPYGNSSPYSRMAGGGGGGIATNVSGMGYGGDRHLDSLLRAAGGRKKGD